MTAAPTILPDLAAAAQPTAAAGVDTKCSHCGLPVPPGLVRPGEREQFCCQGCASVYSVLNSCGLESYYRVRESLSTAARPARTTGARYEEFDDEAYQRLFVRTDGGVAATEFLLEGVHCAACVWLVERLPRLLPGVVSARLSLRRAVVEVVWDAASVRLSEIARTLDSLGYPPHPPKGEAAERAKTRADRRALINLAVAGSCAGNAMLYAFALYGGAFNGMSEEFRTLFRWLSMGLAMLAIAWPGRVFFKGAVAGLRARAPSLDLPIAVALAGGLAWGVANTLRGVGEVYFEGLTMLVFLLLVGRYVQHVQQRRASSSVELLFTLTPSSASLVPDDGSPPRRVPIEAVAVGQTVEVLPGETFPVDGVITHGATQIDAALLTGESRPVEAGPGDTVAAGSTNLGSDVRVRVTACGEDARIGRLMKLVAESADRKGSIVRRADRLAGWFVVATIALATATAGVWLFIRPEEAIEHAVALLIVACPCALGLATPLVMTVALGRSARRGVLVKGADTFERLARPGVILLDKTGTVTEGRLRLVDWRGPRRLRAAVAALESRSTHPIARALAADLAGGTGPGGLPEVGDVRQETGRGISGIVDGRRLAVGSRGHLAALGVPVDADLAERCEAAAALGLTPVLVAEEGRTVAAAFLGDRLRDDARASVDALRRAGWDVRILSGDHPDTVRAVGAELGLAPEACRGGASPEDKLAMVETLAAEGVTVMVGDGVNDAAALAAASVGVAVHGGAEASLEAADVYLARPGLAPIHDLLAHARSALGTINIAIGASIAYNAAGAAMAAAGFITPVVAAILMPLSSLTVVTIALRAGAGAEPRKEV